MSDIEGKVAREAVSEWSRGDASDIDGQNREVEVGGSPRVNVGKERVSKGLGHGPHVSRSRRARPLPHGVTGHVAHSIHSGLQFFAVSQTRCR